MGTPDFAVPSLEALHLNHDVVAVFTMPDRPSGRGRTPVASAVKVAATALGLEVHQPASLRLPEPQELLRSIAPDCIVVAAYGAILPLAVLEVPRFGCVNVHASLLPKWRGAAPIQRSILAHDAVTGVSIMRMEEGLDTGPWCAQATVPVDEKYAPELTSELARLGAEVLVPALADIIRGDAVWKAQNDTEATYAAKVTVADVALHPGLGVSDALARVRASGPSAPCRLTVGNRNLTVVRADRAGVALSPGVAECSRDLILGCADGAIALTTVVPEGKAAMAGADFVRGARLGSCTWRAR